MHSCVSDRRCDLLHRAAYRGFRNGGIEPCGTERAAFTSIVLIFAGALLTGIGVYDKLGAIAGAGSVVPITGFANSIVAPAMEHKREGLVMGVGAELFSLAGPVLVYGITSSVIVGIIAWLTTL